MDFDDLLDSLTEYVPESREDYVKRWWKEHNSNKSEMRQLIYKLLKDHAGDECMFQDLQYKFDCMFDRCPEPESIHHDLNLGDGEDIHFHKAIGNKLLCTENYWGEGGLYRIHKLYNVSSPCLNIGVDDE